MTREELTELSIQLYRNTIYMLDYDLTGLTFNEQRESQGLLDFLLKTDEYALNKCNEDEFLFVKENYILKLQEYSQTHKRDKEEVNKLIEFLKYGFQREND